MITNVHKTNDITIYGLVDERFELTLYEDRKDQTMNEKHWKSDDKKPLKQMFIDKMGNKNKQ